MYQAKTQNILVSVETHFVEEQSNEERQYFVWVYHIGIKNQGKQAVRLVGRHWRITDAHGKTEEVRGDGVVGEKPLLLPNTSFSYTSGTPLNTSSGFMVGSYLMQLQDGCLFEAHIPAFALDIPKKKIILH